VNTAGRLFELIAKKTQLEGILKMRGKYRNSVTELCQMLGKHLPHTGLKVSLTIIENKCHVKGIPLRQI
jgi:hypothetical protein